jgi:HAD superfamily hydrolase (TIGR01509 family)
MTSSSQAGPQPSQSGPQPSRPSRRPVRAPWAGSPAAVLFDLDGTLVDSEPYWIAAEYAVVAEFGGTWTDGHAHAIVGSSLLSAAAYIGEHGGVPLPPAEIVERMLDLVVARLRETVPWRPGALELLAELGAAGVPLALVTMSWSRLTDAVLDALPANTFATVVTGDQVRHGKPHAEPYLTAADRLGVDPGECVAIEDSPTGATSAVAAGCVTIGIPNVVALPERAGLTIVGSLDDLDLPSLAALVARAA